MREGPDIARIAALIGDPARANMLTALMSGKALTATELAGEAGITRATASSHLRRLEEGGLVRQRREGRHKYFSLGDESVALTLEHLMGLAAGQGHLRTRTGPKDTAMRKARVCYNHLAGEMGVRMYQSMMRAEQITAVQDRITLTPKGAAFVKSIGLDVEALPKTKAPLCRPCLDWSARQSHLAGQLGRALLSEFLSAGWLRRQDDSRALRVTPEGARQFERAFGPALTL